LSFVVGKNLPPDIGDVITVEACARYGFHCPLSYFIEIKKCGTDDYVFHLGPTFNAAEAYCIGMFIIFVYMKYISFYPSCEHFYQIFYTEQQIKCKLCSMF